jgi:nicastrin
MQRRYSIDVIVMIIMIMSTVSYAALDQPFTVSYSSLQHAPCVTLFYRLGRIGCSTEDHDSKQIGKLIYYQGTIPDKNDRSNDQYVTLVEDYAMTSNTIKTLLQDKGTRLKGILVLNSTSLNTGNTIYSTDTRTPQGTDTPSSLINYGYIQYPWNSRGEDILANNLYGIPIAYITESNVAQALRVESEQALSSKNNAIVAEFNYYMGPEAMDSPSCLGWKDVSNNEWKPKCLPLGGLSVWAHTGSPPPHSSSSSSSSSSSGSQQPVILLSAGMDSTNLYHDLSTGANTAASNIITMLMAAKLLGSALTDVEYDALPNRIVLSLFQGESYGFVGSRNFLRDVAYPGFVCSSDIVRSHVSLGDKSEYGCLHPLRPNLRFSDIGEIDSMLSIDQVGHAVANGILYAHTDAGTTSGSKILNYLKYSNTNQFSVVASSAADTGYGYPYPPSPLTSLLQLSGGTIGGAVLTGYDYDFPSKLPYHTEKDVPAYIELQTIAATATIIARTVLAAAYDDGTYSGAGDYSTPTTYAKNLIPELSYNDATLIEISNCFLYNGNCDMIMKYSSMEALNEKLRTGIGIDIGESLGTPPNYYVGTYSYSRGQPYVQVGDEIYGAYNGSDYGKSSKTDNIIVQPKQLESTIYGLFNDFLGRGSVSSDTTTTSCKKLSDCSNIESICKNNAYDIATCSGSGVCVCVRAQYHIALDEALQPMDQMTTGYFYINATNDAEVSPIYTEPYWSASVGVRIYRDGSAVPGFISLFVGLGVGAISFFGALVLKVGLKKEKLY